MCVCGCVYLHVFIYAYEHPYLSVRNGLSSILYWPIWTERSFKYVGEIREMKIRLHRAVVVKSWR